MASDHSRYALTLELFMTCYLINEHNSWKRRKEMEGARHSKFPLYLCVFHANLMLLLSIPLTDFLLQHCWDLHYLRPLLLERDRTLRHQNIPLAFPHVYDLSAMSTASIGAYCSEQSRIIADKYGTGQRARAQPLPRRVIAWLIKRPRLSVNGSCSRRISLRCPQSQSFAGKHRSLCLCHATARKSPEIYHRPYPS